MQSNGNTGSAAIDKRLLVIDDEENMRHMLVSLLRGAYRVDAVGNGQQGIEKLQETHYDFILCDLKMPKMDGMEFLSAGADRLGASTVIMMSAYGTIDTAVEAMKKGAYDYISKPFKADEVLMALRKAEEREHLRHENRLLRERIRTIEQDFEFGFMVARSTSMHSVFNLARKVAQYNTTVLISGESGTGKELLAQGIHSHSQRSRRAMVGINCGGIPENLLESEFFGYKRGAFTGAERDKRGLFAEADGGTIFLDEIGELPLALQVKLLRVLQEHEIRPIGAAKTRRIDVRVITATAKNLAEEVQRGRFRNDLFYRLNVMPIMLPALRERREDIPLLVRHFISKFNKLLEKRIQDITPAAMSYLLDYAWPGNVRELENTIERAVVLAEESVLRAQNFSHLAEAEAAGKGFDGVFEGYSLKASQRVLEKKMIVRALRSTGGNRTRAARLLEISHPSLLNKMKRYEIDM